MNLRLHLHNNLPFVSITVRYHGKRQDVHHVLIDTGSASTMLATDAVEALGIVPMPQDVLHTIRGVGGIDVVFERTLDILHLGSCQLHDFPVDIGGMDYGFQMNGIIGMDALQAAGAIIDLQGLQITGL